MSRENLSSVVEYRFVEPEFVDPEHVYVSVEDPAEVARWRENYERWAREIEYLGKWLAASRPTKHRTKLVVRTGEP